MAIYCYKCGAECEDNAKFCGKCGANLAEIKTAPQDQPEKKPEIPFRQAEPQPMAKEQESAPQTELLTPENNPTGYGSQPYGGGQPNGYGNGYGNQPYGGGQPTGYGAGNGSQPYGGGQPTGYGNGYGNQPYGNQPNGYGTGNGSQPNGYGAGNGSQPYGGTYGYNPQAQMNPPNLGMKWFKFVIYFQLFAAAVLNMISGANLFYTLYDGGYYDAVGQGVTLVDQYVVIASFYALGMVALAIFNIFTRFRLAAFKKNSPKLYIAGLAVANIALPVFLSVAMSVCVAIFAADSGIPFSYEFFDYVMGSFALEELVASTASSVLVGVVMIVLNNIYFNKRAHLFCN